MFDYEILERIVSRHETMFGQAGVTDITAFETTSFNFIFFFQCADKQFVLKVMKKGAKNEFTVMSEAKKHIDVPNPLSFGEIDDDEYLLMERAPGKDAKSLLNSMDMQDKANYLFNSAKILAKLHRSTFRIRPHDRLITSRFITADEIKEEMTKMGFGDWSGLRALKAMEQDDDPENVCLVHGRFIPSNLMMHEKKVSGVVDWSESFWGSPFYDLGYTLFILNTLGLDASLFLRSYKEEWSKPFKTDLKQETRLHVLENMRELLPYFETLAAIDLHVLSLRIRKDPKLVEIINHPANEWIIKAIDAADRVAGKLG